MFNAQPTGAVISRRALRGTSCIGPRMVVVDVVLLSAKPSSDMLVYLRDGSA